MSNPGRNVIVVAVESLRHDMISAEHEGIELLPCINELTRQGVTWNKAYSQSTHSDYADVCLVSSLFPLRSRKHHFYQADDPWPRTMLHDVLAQEGYSTAIISSQNEDWGGMSNFLQTENLDCFYHPGNQAKTPTQNVAALDSNALIAGKFPDSHTTDAAMKWIEEQSRNGKSFCLGMNLQSSHFPYAMEEEVEQPFHPSTLDSSIKFSSYPKNKVNIVRNAYYNAIRECDRQVGRLVEKLKQIGQWDNTILIVTGENGESFHENGCVGHAGNPMEPQIHVAALMVAPGLLEQRTEEYPFQHVDLAPTILNLLGQDSHPNFQGVNVLADDRDSLESRMLFFHVLSPIARSNAVQYAGRWKFMTSYENKLGVLYDLENDPTESKDVSNRYPLIRKALQSAVEQWEREQLAYYNFPSYYRDFYPPKQPRIEDVCNSSGIDFGELRDEGRRSQ